MQLVFSESTEVRFMYVTSHKLATTVIPEDESRAFCTNGKEATVANVVSLTLSVLAERLHCNFL